MNSCVLNHAALENIILGFREQGCYLEGFDTAFCQREGNAIRWRFLRDCEEVEFFEGAVLKHEGIELVHLTPERTFKSWAGDRITINYRLSWEDHGGDGPLTAKANWGVDRLTFNFSMCS